MNDSNENQIISPEVSGPSTSFECPSSGLFPSPDDCSIYFQCTQDGIAHQQTCASGLHFNPETKICDWPDNVQCTLSMVLHKIITMFGHKHKSKNLLHYNIFFFQKIFQQFNFGIKKLILILKPLFFIK